MQGTPLGSLRVVCLQPGFQLLRVPERARVLVLEGDWRLVSLLFEALLAHWLEVDLVEFTLQAEQVVTRGAGEVIHAPETKEWTSKSSCFMAQ